MHYLFWKSCCLFVKCFCCLLLLFYYFSFDFFFCFYFENFESVGRIPSFLFCKKLGILFLSLLFNLFSTEISFWLPSTLWDKYQFPSRINLLDWGFISDTLSWGTTITYLLCILGDLLSEPLWWGECFEAIILLNFFWWSYIPIEDLILWQYLILFPIFC